MLFLSRLPLKKNHSSVVVQLSVLVVQSSEVVNVVVPLQASDGQSVSVTFFPSPLKGLF